MRVTMISSRYVFDMKNDQRGDGGGDRANRVGGRACWDACRFFVAPATGASSGCWLEDEHQK